MSVDVTLYTINLVTSAKKLVGEIGGKEKTTP